LVAATVLLFAKLIGVWIGLSLSNATFSLVTLPELMTYVAVSSLEQVKTVTTAADSTFIALAVLAGVFVLVKTTLLNDLTRHPRILVKVVHYNLTGWLEDGQSMYPKLFAWGMFLWLAFILVLKDYLTLGLSVILPTIMGIFCVFYTYEVFSFLDTHISDMISYLYGTKRKTS
jgi:hypothetical protein